MAARGGRVQSGCPGSGAAAGPAHGDFGRGMFGGHSGERKGDILQLDAETNSALAGRNKFCVRRIATGTGLRGDAVASCNSSTLQVAIRVRLQAKYVCYFTGKFKLQTPRTVRSVGACCTSTTHFLAFSHLLWSIPFLSFQLILSVLSPLSSLYCTENNL